MKTLSSMVMMLRSRLDKKENLREREMSPGGFTLIEMIGVLAVIAIAAMVLLPNMIKRVDTAAADAESQTLKSMTDSLKLYIRRNWSIPNHNNWADALSQQMGWEKGAVLTNGRGIARAYLIDPDFKINGASLPYTQTVLGCTNKPSNARLMIVSSLFTPLPVSSGVMSSSNDFNSVWNTPEDSVPSIWSGWNGAKRGDLLKIQRINLEPMFKYISVNKSTTAAVSFGVGTNYDLTGVDKINLLGPTFSTYYLEGTILYLYRTNGMLDMRQVIESDQSFYFANNIWGGQPAMGAQITGQDFQSCADFFLMALLNSNARNGATPQTVVNALIDYMNAYVAWANAGFDKRSPAYSALQAAQSELDSQTSGLIWKPAP
ncbi:MAG: type II secretion system protein [Verrucomicrobiia bacterium]